jgi:beta-galactosidase/beta-glucuronidase
MRSVDWCRPGCGRAAGMVRPILAAIDMWRLAGIHRDVYLMATPRVHARDLFVTTDLDAAYRDAELRVEAELAN